MSPSFDHTTVMARGVRWVLAVSALTCCVLVPFIFRGENGTLSDFGSDHTSHVSSAILFTHVGFKLYRVPVRELCPNAESDEGCTVAGRVGRPLHINWAQFPRPYPPGAMLYAAPEAALWAWTSIDRRTMNHLSVIKYVAVAHVLMWFVFLAIARGLELQRERKPWWRGLLVVSALALTYLIFCEALRFSLLGIYDSIAVLAVFLAVSALHAQKPVNALLAMCSAFFFHYRALWFAPVMVLAVGDVIRTRAFQHREARIKLLLAAFLLGTTGLSLILVAPWLTRFPDTNLLHAGDSPALAIMGGTAVLCAGIAAWKRDWLLLMCIACQVVVLLRTPQSMPWHALFLLPFLVVGANRGRVVFGAVVALYFAQSTWVFWSRPQPRALYGPLSAQVKAALENGH